MGKEKGSTLVENVVLRGKESLKKEREEGAEQQISGSRGVGT